jgi:uncharacterized protein YbaP (TraB family)
LIPCFLLGGLFAQEIKPTHQLLWQITGKNVKKPSYLFGTFHSNDPRLFAFSDSTYITLLETESLVLETDIYAMFTQVDARITTPELRFDSKGKPYTINSKASISKYGNEDGRPQFLDAYFQQIAYNSGKKFFPLETLESQLEVFDQIYNKQPRQLSLKTQVISQENLLSTYINGDIESLRQLLYTQLTNFGEAFDLLISKRNYTMVAGIDTLIKKNNLFIAVGAAHLSGQDGIIQLLRNKGYHLRPVQASFSQIPTEAEKKLRTFGSYVYKDSVFGFQAKFGGRPVLEKTDEQQRLIYQELGQGNTYWVETILVETNYALDFNLEELFFTDKQVDIQEIKLKDGTKAFQGITDIYNIGFSWRRVFVKNGILYKLTCFGGNKFMNSDRPNRFFDGVLVQ